MELRVSPLLAVSNTAVRPGLQAHPDRVDARAHTACAHGTTCTHVPEGRAALGDPCTALQLCAGMPGISATLLPWQAHGCAHGSLEARNSPQVCPQGLPARSAALCPRRPTSVENWSCVPTRAPLMHLRMSLLRGLIICGGHCEPSVVAIPTAWWVESVVCRCGWFGEHSFRDRGLQPSLALARHRHVTARVG